MGERKRRKTEIAIWPDRRIGPILLGWSEPRLLVVRQTSTQIHIMSAADDIQSNRGKSNPNMPWLRRSSSRLNMLARDPDEDDSFLASAHGMHSPRPGSSSN